MSGPSEPRIWNLTTLPQIEAILQAVHLALSTQDRELKYTASLNPPLAFEGLEFIGRTDEETFPNAAGAHLRTSKERVLTSGEGERFDISVGDGGEARWFRVWVEPLANGALSPGVLSASIEITEQKTTEELLRLALLELAHRSKNLLSVILSIARQTTEESHSLADFNGRFLGRIRSLSLAHDVLTDERWRGATVFGLVRSQLSAFAENAIQQSEIAGHNAFLKPNAVQYVGLALHELIAQSILSGALAQPAGHIRVLGSLLKTEPDKPADLVLTWEETGVQRSSASPASAFGFALLEKIVPAALNGTARLDLMEPGKITYTLQIPNSEFF
jgi:two-component sensor histidine kinase